MLRSTGWPARGSRRPSARKLMLGAIAGCAFLGAAGSASAATCTPPACLAFNWAVLDAGGSNADIVTPGTAPITVTPSSLTPTGTYTADFTVDPSGVSFPAYNFTTPTNGTITTTLANTAHGTLDFATGALTMAADFLATVQLQGVPGTCTLDTGTVNLSTANTQPLPGHAFPAGSSGIPTGAGAFGGTWSSVTATPHPSTSSSCQLLQLAGYTGAGGLWVSRNISPIPPALGITFNKLKTAKRGRTVAIKAKVANTAPQYGNPTGPLTACLKVPKQLKLKSHRCMTLSSISQGQSVPVSFKVKTNKHKHGKYKLTLTVTGTNLSATKTITLKVRK